MAAGSWRGPRLKEKMEPTEAPALATPHSFLAVDDIMCFLSPEATAQSL